jgi:hypothetical protein
MEENVSPILHVKNAAHAVEWYVRLGFIKESEHRFEPALPAFVTIMRGLVRIFLLEHKGDARPDTLIYLSLRNLDDVAAEFGVPVEEAPWGREIELRDPDSNRIRIGSLA